MGTSSLIPSIRSVVSFAGKSAEKKPKTSAFLYGLIAAATLPPLFFVPLLFLSFCGVLSLLMRRPCWKSCFWMGWWFGFGYFLAGLYWISFALGVDIHRFMAMIPFAVAGLPAFLAFFVAFAFGLTRSVSRGLSRVWGLPPFWEREQFVFLFALLWTFFEGLRGYLFTGFPWNLLGYCWMSFLPVAQILSVTGIYGLSFLTVLWAASPFLKRTVGLSLLGTFALCAVWGTWRLQESVVSFVPDLTLRLVQPSIPQKMKWSDAHREENFQRMISLSTQPARSLRPLGFSSDLLVYVWPESATPFFLANDSARRLAIMRALGDRSLLITGTPRGEKSPWGNIKIWNSLIAVNPQGTVLGIYDKAHLVPFGEYIPFRDFLPPWIRKVTRGALDYSSGVGVQTLQIAGLPPFSPMICYEIIFPGHVKTTTPQKPQWILNITNDAWYGRTSGPYQHLAITQARAIEEGIPVVRVANNGISAIIDPYGRLIQKLGLDVRGVLEGSLPRPLSVPTLYSQYGNTVFGLLYGGVLFLLMLGSCMMGRRSSKKI